MFVLLLIVVGFWVMIYAGSLIRRERVVFLDLFLIVVV